MHHCCQDHNCGVAPLPTYYHLTKPVSHVFHPRCSYAEPGLKRALRGLGSVLVLVLTWPDGIIHRIHLRVLNPVRALAEGAG